MGHYFLSNPHTIRTDSSPWKVNVMVAIFASLAATYTRDVSHRVTRGLKKPQPHKPLLQLQLIPPPFNRPFSPTWYTQPQLCVTKILGNEVGVQGQFQVQQMKPKTHSLGCPSTTQGCLKLGESDLGHVPSCIYMTYNSVSSILSRNNFNVLTSSSES